MFDDHKKERPKEAHSLDTRELIASLAAARAKKDERIALAMGWNFNDLAALERAHPQYAVPA